MPPAKIRSLLFILIFYPFTVALVLVSFPLILAPPRALSWLYPFHGRCTLFLLRHIVGLNFTVQGSENLPQAPFIIAAKHQSAWETFVFGALVKNPVLVLKKELLLLPLLGPILQHQGMIPIARSKKGGRQALNKMLATAKKAAQQRHPIIIFPEGTRHIPGTPAHYQRGVVLFYEALKIPVVPVALNSGFFWGRRQLWKNPGTITIHFLPPIFPGLDRDSFCQILQESIETAYQKIIPSV